MKIWLGYVKYVEKLLNSIDAKFVEQEFAKIAWMKREFAYFAKGDLWEKGSRMGIFDVRKKDKTKAVERKLAEEMEKEYRNRLLIFYE